MSIATGLSLFPRQGAVIAIRPGGQPIINHGLLFGQERRIGKRRGRSRALRPGDMTLTARPVFRHGTPVCQSVAPLCRPCRVHAIPGRYGGRRIIVPTVCKQRRCLPIAFRKFAQQCQQLLLQRAGHIDMLKYIR